MALPYEQRPQDFGHLSWTHLPMVKEAHAPAHWPHFRWRSKQASAGSACISVVIAEPFATMTRQKMAVLDKNGRWFVKTTVDAVAMNGVHCSPFLHTKSRSGTLPSYLHP